MNANTLFLRYLLFLVGMFLLSIGIDFIVVSALGASPISSVNYVMSLGLPLSFGAATLIFNFGIIVLELGLMWKKYTKKDICEILLQIPFTFIFSFLIDLNMLWMEKLSSANYLCQLGLLVVGCIIQALGIAMEVNAQVVIMAPEGFVKYYCRRFNRDFGKVKVEFDCVLVLTAILFSLALTGNIKGLREGTLITAVSTGLLVSLISKHLLVIKI